MQRSVYNGVIVLMVLLVLVLVSACATDEKPHWGYEGDVGPANWSELSSDFAVCDTGTQQSPVNIPSEAPVNSSDNLRFSYQPSAVNILNNGHTVQVDYDSGSSFVSDGTTYNLKQFHFHANSEHRLNGEPLPMEVHFVHTDADGKYAVIGVLVEAGAENSAYTPVMQNLPVQETAVTRIDAVTVNADALMPASRDFYRYNGSLTTPSCAENVKWFVLGEKVELSPEQIQAYTSIYDDNFRPVQPMNERSFLTVNQ